MKEIFKDYFEFPLSNFVDYYIAEDFTYRSKSGKLLIVFSEEENRKGQIYCSHVFEVVGKILMWREKYYFNTFGLYLRDQNPLMELNNGRYIVLIEKNEYSILISAYNGPLLPTKYKFKNKVFEAHYCCGDQLYVSFYYELIIQSFRLILNENFKDNTATVELEGSGEINFGVQYIAFDVDDEGYAIVFDGYNRMTVYYAESYIKLNYLKTLPLFRFEQYVMFHTNFNYFKPIFSRKNEFLFIIMQNIEFLHLKYLFAYNIHHTSHNSLIAVHQMLGDYSNLDNHVYIDLVDKKLSTYIYLFYGGKLFQYIRFYARTHLIKDSENSDHIFLQRDLSDVYRYARKNFTLSIYPIFRNELENATLSSDDDSLIVNIETENSGLMVERKIPESHIPIFQNGYPVYANLLGMFDSFNSTYRLINISSDSSEFEYYLTDKQEYVVEYIVESVSNNNQIINTFEYSIDKNVILFILYSQNSTMHAYSLKGNITRIPEEYDYEYFFG